MSTHLETLDSTIRRMVCAAALSLPLFASAAGEAPAQGIRLQLYVAYGEPSAARAAGGEAVLRPADALTIDNCAASFTAASTVSGAPERLADAGVLVLWVPTACPPGTLCAGDAQSAAGYLAVDAAGHSLIP